MKGLSALLLAAWPVFCTASFIPENQRQFPTVTIYVSPQGDDAGDGTQAHPFQSLARAQRAVRSANNNADVTVELADGVYRLSEPLQFRAADGGQAGTRVVWTAAAKASPVIAGSLRVTGWKLHDAARRIFVADIPRGVDSRQVWLQDRLARRASIELARASVAFDAEGMTIDDPNYDYLAGLPAQDRIEVQSTGWFTNRISPVSKIAGRKLLMQQPAWDNNTWGYDTLNAPVGAETAHLFLNNSLESCGSRSSSTSTPMPENSMCVPPTAPLLRSSWPNYRACRTCSPSVERTNDRCAISPFAAFAFRTPAGWARRRATDTSTSKAARS